MSKEQAVDEILFNIRIKQAEKKEANKDHVVSNKEIVWDYCIERESMNYGKRHRSGKKFRKG